MNWGLSAFIGVIVLFIIGIFLAVHLSHKKNKKESSVEETSSKLKSLRELNSKVRIDASYQHVFQEKVDFRGNRQRRKFNSYNGKDLFQKYAAQMEEAAEKRRQNLADIREYRLLVSRINRLTLTPDSEIRKTGLKKEKYLELEEKLFNSEIKDFNDSTIIRLEIVLTYISDKGSSYDRRHLSFSEEDLNIQGHLPDPTPWDFKVIDTLKEEKEARQKEEKKASEEKQRIEIEKEKQNKLIKEKEAEEERIHTSEASIDNCHYLLKKDGTAVLDSGTKAEGELFLPTDIHYKNYTWKVTAIGKEAFKDNKNLISAVLPSDLEVISDSAFAGCSSLKYVSFDKALRSVEKEAFKGCSSLTSVRLNDGLLSLGERSFAMCPSLENIRVPRSVKSIKAGFLFLSEKAVIELETKENLSSFDEEWNSDENEVKIILPDDNR